ncbi:hypothetical protein ACFSKY_08610 [Azotobacter chroococcum]|uniref:SPOR domain-containing protein n=1 Tax=Azotobacter chroococcum TaxID=353 RepID=A0A4R1PW46_9GAMM|nr:hypothetical protein [Azotobacter chroococcum]NHN75996.1 hypothetical protein [Azotobacter chroococcum]TCL32374.1 hypothetical protein EV691_108145 [Azotobacter chroococcum]
MQVIVQPIAKPQGHWTVRLGALAVPFRNEREARQFASRLESRLQAPHPWPGRRG